MKDMVYDTADPAVRLQMDDEVRVIEALPAVRGLQYLPASRSKDAGYQATLMCYAGREHGGCGKKTRQSSSRTPARHCSAVYRGCESDCADSRRVMAAPVLPLPKQLELPRRLPPRLHQRQAPHLRTPTRSRL